MLQDAGLTVDVSDRAPAGGGVRQSGIERHQPLAAIERELSQVFSAHRPVADRKLAAATVAIIDHRECVSAHPRLRRDIGPICSS
jgi:hypothetical protein